MTPDALEALVLETRSSLEVARAFADFTEAERRRLSKHASSLHRQIERSEAAKTASARLTKFLARPHRRGAIGYGQASLNAHVAVLAACPLSTVRRIDHGLWGDELREAVIQVLQDRRPEWLEQWLAHQLDAGDRFPRLDWLLVRTLIELGLCEKPGCDGYIRLFASAQSAWSWPGQRPDEGPIPPLSQRLLAAPDLLDDVMRLFEVETDAFLSDRWSYPEAEENHETWHEALVRLAKEGHLNRDHLLDATLSGLTLGHKQSYLAAIHKFHVQLEPTAEETKAREARYFELLSNPVGHVVGFALQMLGRLEKAKLLDAARCLPELGAVFQLSTKGTAVRALRLCARVARRNPGVEVLALRTAIDALSHPALDVQEAAVALIEPRSDRLDEEARGLVGAAVGQVSASLEPRLMGIVGDDSPDAAEPSSQASWTEGEALLAAFRALSERERATLGLAERDITERHVDALAPWSTELSKLRVIDGAVTAEPIEPITDLETLIDAVAHAIEVLDSAEEIERILDGVSRLADDKPSDFAARAAPLAKRLREGTGAATARGLADGWSCVALALRDLLLTWLTGHRHLTPDNPECRGADPLRPIENRVRALIERVHGGRAQPLLALPTHRGGWIDPSVLVERLTLYQQRAHLIDTADFNQALLRLAPDQRPAALAAARSLGGSPGRIVRFALGGDEPTCPNDRRQYDLWIAAGRARDPKADWTETFSALQLSSRESDVLTPARYEWDAVEEPHERAGYQDDLSRISIHVSNDFGEMRNTAAKPTSSSLGDRIGSVLKRVGNITGGTTSADWRRLPTAALHGRIEYGWLSPELMCPWTPLWLSMTWPLNLDSFYVIGIRSMMRRVDQNSSNWSPNFPFLHPLFETNRPWSELAQVLLCVSLVGKDTDARGLAVDAFIEGVDDGRAHPEPLAAILIRFAQADWLKLNRLAETSSQVSAVSPLHAWVVSELLQRFIDGVGLKMRNLHHVLTTLLEIQSGLEGGLLTSTVQTLSKFEGSGKTARLAKQIAALPTVDSPVVSRAWASFLRARMDRLAATSASPNRRRKSGLTVGYGAHIGLR